MALFLCAKFSAAIGCGLFPLYGRGHDTAKAAYAAFAVFKRFYRGNEKNLLQIALHCFFVLKFNQFAEI